MISRLVRVNPTNGRRRHPFNQSGYQTLLEPDGPIYFAGDHVSHIVGWQEGAAISACARCNRSPTV